jgi:F0F1-type ATP synthase gamma subunit
MNARAHARRALQFFFIATKETQVMQFQKGQSGNPAGRPRGSRNKTTMILQSLLEGEAEEIARKAIEMAKAGDMAAIRVCMDRLASIRRKDPIAFELPPVDKASDSVAAMAAVVAAVAAGDLTTDEAAEMAKIINAYVCALAATAFEERLERLERAANIPSPPPLAPVHGDHAVAAADA